MVLRRRTSSAAPTTLPTRTAPIRLVADRQHYEALLAKQIPSATVSLWIATANLKELRLPAPVGTRARAQGQSMSVLEVLAALGSRGVELRILHSRPPSRAFVSALASLPHFRPQLALRCCPRQHMKLIVIDGRLLYLGSANFTGAGLGARGEHRRNFEMGVITEDEYMLDTAQARFDAIWNGHECKNCGLRRLCPKPIDSLISEAP